MIRDELSWDELFILQATLIAQKSKDPSTKVGCVIVNDDNVILSTGFNGFPRGIEEDWKDRWKRPEKYHWVEHAERNAIFNAADHLAAVERTAKLEGLHDKNMAAYGFEDQDSIKCCG